MKYRVTKQINYQPEGKAKKAFKPEDILDTSKLPTKMPIEWLLGDGAIEEIVEKEENDG